MDELTQDAIDKAYQNTVAKLFDGLFAAYVTAFDDLDKANALTKFSNGVAIVKEAKDGTHKEVIPKTLQMLMNKSFKASQV